MRRCATFSTSTAFRDKSTYFIRITVEPNNRVQCVSKILPDVSFSLECHDFNESDKSCAATGRKRGLHLNDFISSELQRETKPGAKKKSKSDIKVLSRNFFRWRVKF